MTYDLSLGNQASSINFVVILYLLHKIVNHSTTFKFNMSNMQLPRKIDRNPQSLGVTGKHWGLFVSYFCGFALGVKIPLHWGFLIKSAALKFFH